MNLQLSRREQAALVNFAHEMSRFSTHPSDIINFVRERLTSKYSESELTDYIVALETLSLSLRTLLVSLDIRKD